MKIKEFFELSKNRKAAIRDIKLQPLKKDEEGASIVDIRVDEDDDFLSPYGRGDTLVISEEMAGYLKNTTEGISVKNNLHLKIKCRDINENNKEKFQKSIKTYYTNRFYEVERKLKLNAFAVLVTFVLALVFLGIWVLIENMHSPAVVTLIIEIVAWVFMWEAVDLFIFERTVLRHQKNKILQLLNAKISFDLTVKK